MQSLWQGLYTGWHHYRKGLCRSRPGRQHALTNRGNIITELCHCGRGATMDLIDQRQHLPLQWGIVARVTVDRAPHGCAPSVILRTRVGVSPRYESEWKLVSWRLVSCSNLRLLRQQQM
jgi:hypothetical protein